MAGWDKPYPNIDHDNRELWEGFSRHEFLLWTCGECGACYWPKSYCRNHENEPFAAQMSWQPCSGRGQLFAYNVHHVAFHPGFKDDVPYSYALVELEEGPLVSTTFVGRPPTPGDVGKAVEIVYEDHPDEGFSLPRFKLMEQ